jgi:hypothetical protein
VARKKAGEVKEVEEMEEAREKASAGRMDEEICGFGEDNMKEFSMELARE